MELPASLVQRLDDGANARTLAGRDDLFRVDSWTHVLMGQGHAGRPPPLARALPMPTCGDCWSRSAGPSTGGGADATAARVHRTLLQVCTRGLGRHAAITGHHGESSSMTDESGSAIPLRGRYPAVACLLALALGATSVAAAQAQVAAASGAEAHPELWPALQSPNAPDPALEQRIRNCSRA